MKINFQSIPYMQKIFQRFHFSTQTTPKHLFWSIDRFSLCFFANRKKFFVSFTFKKTTITTCVFFFIQEFPISHEFILSKSDFIGAWLICRTVTDVVSSSFPKWLNWLLFKCYYHFLPEFRLVPHNFGVTMNVVWKWCYTNKSVVNFVHNLMLSIRRAFFLPSLKMDKQNIEMNMQWALKFPLTLVPSYSIAHDEISTLYAKRSHEFEKIRQLVNIFIVRLR